MVALPVLPALRRRGLLLAALLPLLNGAALAAPGATAPAAGDPYQSMPWQDMHKEFLGSAPAEFDTRVMVRGPSFAADPMNVPISVQVDPALGPVDKVVVLVDRNPIRRVLEYVPLQARPTISFRFKLEQASPVRAAVLARDGRWHVGSTWVDSAGGGCTVAGATRADGTWSQTLGNVNGRLFSAPPDGGAAARLRVQVMHPMDTGLVAGVPAFYVNRLSVRDGRGQELARMQAYEPVSENPVFSFDFATAPVGGVTITGTDNNGNRIAGTLQ